MSGFAGISGSGTAGADESSGVGFGSGSPRHAAQGILFIAYVNFYY